MSLQPHVRLPCDRSAARTKAIFSAPGLYELELSATDSEFTRTTRLNVKVG